MNENNSPIIGIDLGTTNSVVAAMVNGRVEILQEDGESILPSIVGITAAGKLVVGQTAKNQLAVFPDRTVASIKRRMGQAVKVKLADQEFTPQEISAIILRRLRQRAETVLQTEITRAVITVPAFFDEAQRQATREAGQLAGLTVERIINEPTAASLVYHASSPQRRHLIVYDLGGGTFDVSIVRIEAGVVEVLSSRGDTQLGGDDFDQLLTRHVAATFLDEHNFDLLADASTRWRLLQACERAKCELSTLSSVTISEEFIATVDGKPLNLVMTITRPEYERLITSLVERTIQCVDEAIRDSGLTLSQIDELILVGGSTRTPLVQQRLSEEFQRDLQWAVNPDLAVALGAATQGAMQNGHAVGPVLIDVTSHTMGIEALSGSPRGPQLVFCPIIRRNAPLPAKYEDIFRTMNSSQRNAEIHVLQGESTQIERNRSIGRFVLEGVNESQQADGTILVRFELTLDGILKVTAIERQTGLAKTLQIENALSKLGETWRAEATSRLDQMFDGSDEFFSRPLGAIFDGEESHASDALVTLDDTLAPSGATMRLDAASTPHSHLPQLMAKAKELRSSLVADDAADVDRLIELIQEAERDQNRDLLSELTGELDDLLFYLAE